MTENEISRHVYECAIEFHRTLGGPGLLESVYETCLAFELRKRGFLVLNQLPIPVIYDEICIELGYRIDLLVNGAVVVEIKAVSKLMPIHEAQLLSYLKLSGKLPYRVDSRS